jgi:hypothetical protein
LVTTTITTGEATHSRPINQNFQISHGKNEKYVKKVIDKVATNNLLEPKLQILECKLRVLSCRFAKAERVGISTKALILAKRAGKVQ